MELNFDKLMLDVQLLCKQVGAWQLEEQKNFDKSKIEIKGLNDLVSYVDKSSELQLVNGLKNIFPLAGFITEENTLNNIKEYNWIIDPLDGTTNYLHGMPNYAISVALSKRDEIILGVVYKANGNECYSAFKNNGAFLNKTKLSVSGTAKISAALIGTGFPINNFTKINEYLKTLAYFMQNTHGIRRIGAASLDLCFLAEGKLDAFFEYNLNAWDVAAGSIIVKEAGGNIFDFNGGCNWLFGKEIIASNNYLSKEILSVIKNNFSL
ncbi:MAG: inositol monophosphatase [Bacteroidetes bacterium]|nr:inositol monophosphatase [Bacteroidota bacterium]